MECDCYVPLKSRLSVACRVLGSRTTMAECPTTTRASGSPRRASLGTTERGRRLHLDWWIIHNVPDMGGGSFFSGAAVPVVQS